jgi:hypothetical protein
MITACVVDDAEPRTGYRGDQQEQTDKLEQQTPRLLDPAAMLQLSADIGTDPESQGRHDLVPLRAVEQVKRNYAGGDRAHQAEKLTEI